MKYEEFIFYSSFLQLSKGCGNFGRKSHLSKVFYIFSLTSFDIFIHFILLLHHSTTISNICQWVSPWRGTLKLLNCAVGGQADVTKAVDIEAICILEITFKISPTFALSRLYKQPHPPHPLQKSDWQQCECEQHILVRMIIVITCQKALKWSK